MLWQLLRLEATTGKINISIISHYMYLRSFSEMADVSEQQPLLNHGTSSEAGSCGSQCAEIIRDEFHLRNFGFDFDLKEVFYNCQWHWPKGVYLFYRFILLAYAMTILVLSIVIFDHNKWHAPWPVFLTHWSYLVLTAHLLVAAIISLMHIFDEDSGIRIALNSVDRGITYQHTSNPFYMKLSWLLFAIASGAAFVVTCIYFSAVFPQRGINYLSVVDINLHLMNSVIIFLEFIISALPVRLLHGIYLFLYGLTYVAFSIIYWSVDHANVLYPGVLDWNYPGRTMVYMLCVAIIGIPLLQSILFGLYRVRLFIYCKIHFRRL